jgi:hypothetical protein
MIEAHSVVVATAGATSRAAGDTAPREVRSPRWRALYDQVFVGKAIERYVVSYQI